MTTPADTEPAAAAGVDPAHVIESYKRLLERANHEIALRDGALAAERLRNAALGRDIAQLRDDLEGLHGQVSAAAAPDAAAGPDAGGVGGGG